MSKHAKRTILATLNSKHRAGPTRLSESAPATRVYSDSDAVGEEFSAIETGDNTGVFKLAFTTSLESQSNLILVDQEDDVFVQYTDEFPANYTMMEKTFTYSLTIGHHGDGDTLAPSPPRIDSAGTPATGNQMTISTTLTSHVEGPQPSVELFEVRDSDGVAVFLAWQSGTIKAFGQTDIGVSWIPDRPGDYTVRTFAISDLANPDVLSQVAESDFTVE